MKASLACLFLAISSLYCHSQEQASNALALEHSSSLATISTAVRVVSSVTEVNLVFTVTHGRRLVDNLRAEDLKILDNGQPAMRVTSFESKTNLPIRLALLIDESDSVRGRFKFEQNSAIQFLKRVLRRGDSAMVIGFNQHAVLAQDSTDDSRLLARGIKNMKPGGDTALFDALSFGARKLAQLHDNEPVRRVIVLLSDGQENSSRGRLEKAVNEALFAEAAVFAITSEQADICRGFVVCQQGEATLKTLADSSGGEFLRAADGNQLASAFRKIGDELRKQYAVSYRPAFNAPDGTFHTVTLYSRKGTLVHCRKGYYARELHQQ